jgi:hypothetical protein
MSEAVTHLISILEIPEEEAVKAILSAFSPCQPGALRQVWLNRKHYGGDVPSTREIWELFERADFRCVLCKSQHRITLDHINANTSDHRLGNLQVLCADCNRAKSRRGMVFQHANVRVYKATLTLYERTGVFPTDSEILRESGMTNLAGGRYLIRFLERRMTGSSRALKSHVRAFPTNRV